MSTVRSRVVKRRLGGAGKRQSDLALVMGLHPSTLSSFLSGAMREPVGFDEKLRAALDKVAPHDPVADSLAAKCLAAIKRGVAAGKLPSHVGDEVVSLCKAELLAMDWRIN